jgi:hypothetical protein
MCMMVACMLPVSVHAAFDGGFWGRGGEPMVCMRGIM